MSPEVYTQTAVDLRKCDIFSLGVFFFVISFGVRPFLSSSPYKNDLRWCLVKEGDWKQFWKVFD